MNHIREYLKPESAQRVEPPQVSCSSCSHARTFTSVPQVVECRQLNKMKNAEMLRACFGFAPK